MSTHVTIFYSGTQAKMLILNLEHVPSSTSTIAVLCLPFSVCQYTCELQKVVRESGRPSTRKVCENSFVFSGLRLFPARIGLYNATDRASSVPSLCRDDGDEYRSHHQGERLGFLEGTTLHSASENTWRHTIAKDVSSLGHSWNSIPKLAGDRQHWMSCVLLPCVRPVGTNGRVSQ